MDLKALLLTHGVIAVTCFSTFVAARQLAPEESPSSPSASSSSSFLCSRVLATTLWGAALAFYSLMGCRVGVLQLDARCMACQKNSCLVDVHAYICTAGSIVWNF
jgi:hypothetical protein